MASYNIIGGDRKQYGPISADEVRRWIAEERLNAQSLAKGEGDEEFRPLGGFPEFVDALAAATATTSAMSPANQPVNEAARAAAMQRIKIPAIALIITGSLGVVYYVINTIIILAGRGAMLQPEMPPNVPPELKSFIEAVQQGTHGPLAVVISILVIALNVFVLFGAIKMLRLQKHTLAVVASVAAMVPCSCCCLLGLPFGIWALVVLNKPEVKSQFS